MGVASKLNTAKMTSSLLEKLLPPTQKHEWVKVAEGDKNHDLFKKLLEYLLSKKKSMKYVNANVRKKKQTNKA